MPAAGDGGLPGHLVAFARLLRGEGLAVTPARSVDAGRSLALLDVSDAPTFRAALRANFTISVDDFAAFDRAFDAFWLPGAEATSASSKPGGAAAAPSAQPLYIHAPLDVQGASPDGDARLPGAERTAGDTEVLTRKDFAAYTAADLPRARRLIQQLVPALATAPSRRFEPANSGGSVDVRRTVQGARRTGGEVVHIERLRPRIRKLRLVALLDVSGSMDVYSQHLLQFFHALQEESGGVHTFAFSTRLRDVTAVLRRRRYGDALAGLSPVMEAWSGGTAIGACLADFNQRHAKTLLGPRTVAVICSDGWERGDVARLRREMALIQRRAHRVIWLNPLKAREGYEPLAAGMAAALPFVDQFLPANSIAALERLKRVLVSA